jgi:HNH endonuclease
MKISAELRKIITNRANRFCEYCLTPLDFSHSPFEAEHITPISKDGKTVSGNLALACRGCNLYKSDKTVGFDAVSDDTVRLYNPRKDDWNDHFGWAKNFTVVIGLTPIGRATVEVLKLNRQGLLNQREMLCKFGKHPPNLS